MVGKKITQRNWVNKKPHRWAVRGMGWGGVGVVGGGGSRGLQNNNVTHDSREWESLIHLLLIPLPTWNKYHKRNLITICCGFNTVSTVITWSYYTAPIWAPCTAAIRPTLARNSAISGMNRQYGSPRLRFGQIDTDEILARHRDWLITPVFPSVLTLCVRNLSEEA